MHPPFLEKISCLAPIMGESGRSGHRLGLDGSGVCFLSAKSRTILRRNFAVASDLRSGLIMGDFEATREFNASVGSVRFAG
jgi:hypothetical protein